MRWWEWVILPFLVIYMIGWILLARLGIVKHPADNPDYFDSDWEPEDEN